MKIRLRLRFLLEAVLSLGAVAVLVRLRPEWPRLPGSLSSPLTTMMVQQFVLVALWLSIALLLCMLFVRSITGLVARSTRPRLHPPSPGQGRASSRRVAYSHPPHSGDVMAGLSASVPVDRAGPFRGDP